MSRQVLVTAAARRDIEEAAAWWAENRSFPQAIRWLRQIEDRIATLCENAERCELAHESFRFSFELRELLFGTGYRPTHRILFRIDGSIVEILAVRHTSRIDLAPDDLD
jgi:plasmid stabilization system protein ParE